MQTEIQVPDSKFQVGAKKAFGEVWYERLKRPINTILQYHIFPKLLEEKKKWVIYPNDMFKAFRDCPNPKVCIIGQSPYAYPKQATGRAFECGNTLSPSLKIILDTAKVTYGDPFAPVLLDSWVNQGVLLLNSTLTIRHGDNNSHATLWRNFIAEVIKSLDSDNMVWMLWGSKARYYKRYIKANSITVEDIYPIAMKHNLDLEFFGGFSTVNSFLVSRQLKPIKWSL